MFVDISGFTNLSERLARRGRVGAEELTAVLDRVFGRMLELVYARGGSLLKFGGDALLLLFESDDSIMQATAAAVEMRAALRDSSKEKTSVGRIGLKMSSGIHTGQIDFFLVGDSHRELLVAGPVASHTTEMESTAEAGEILVSRRIAEQLPSGFLGEVKGSGVLLRKHKIDHPNCGPVARDQGHDREMASFVPRQLREYLSLGLSDSEHRIATIGFIKFKGVDGLLAARGPQVVGTALDQLISGIQKAVDEEQITFLATDIDADGGKVIVAGGVPGSKHDDEGRVLRAARAIADCKFDLSVQIGVNRGHVFAGDVGTEFRRTFTVMGDTVNLAARLMAAAPSGALYSSPGVLDEASTLFHTEALEPLHVKGKEQPVLAYEVLEEIGVRPPETKHELPFHGREVELEMLVSIVTTCAQVGRGGMMTIAGDTGIGKSRLIAEVIDRCPGLATLTIKAEPNGSDNPYWALRDPMRRELGIERADAKEMSRQLSALVRKGVPDLRPLIPLLGDVLHIAVADNDTTAAIDPRFRPGRTADAIIDLLSALHDEPFAVIAEDAQWLDEASRNLLLAIGAAAETRPWSVIATMRGLEGLDAHYFGDGIALPPLDDESIRRITIEATSAAPLRPHALDNIVNRAGGNPLFLSEIIGVVRETGNAENIPDSLDAVVSTQIDSLPPLARQTLRYSSVLGNSFPTLVLDEFLAPDAIEIDEATRTTLERFIEPDGATRLRFKHAVVHDVAYHGLPYRRRKELHGRAGEVVEQMSSHDPAASAEFLAYHFSEAGRHEKAWEYSRIAAAKSQAAFSNSEAVVHYERALESARHLQGVSAASVAETWASLGEVHDMIGDYEEARKAFRRAINAGNGNPERIADIYLRQAETWMGTGNLSQAKRNLTLGRKAVGPLPSSEREGASLARLIAYEASVHAADGEPHHAAACAREAIALGQSYGEREAIARAYGILDWSNFMLGVDEPRHGEEAIEIYTSLGSVSRAAVIMNNMGAFAYLEDQWDKAIDWYEQSLAAAEKSGDVFYAALIRANIAEILISQRRYSEARSPLGEAERTYRASNARHYMPLVDLQWARLFTGETRFSDAIERLEGSLDSQPDSAWSLESRVTLLDALTRDGQLKRAKDLLDAIQQSGSTDTGEFRARLAIASAVLWDGLGDREKAREALTEALQQAIDSGSKFDVVQLAEALISMGDFDSSLQEILDTERAALGIEDQVAAT
ncbi:MAG TPA: adenylate/guanylate cyclase domain-containing protein [Acidimicrobiia bacterium]|nr:adenylate/guanylate cyclase domain-containing protein [Acidimicrobiia bacterium]